MVKTVKHTLVNFTLLDCTRHLLHHRVILPFYHLKIYVRNVAFLNYFCLFSVERKEIILFIGIFPCVEFCVYTAQKKTKSFNNLSNSSWRNTMKLYVGNLGDDGNITSGDLRPLFEQYGTVTECECIKNYA